MRAGKALREQWQDQAAARQPCPSGCAHLHIQHHELPREIFTVENGEIVAHDNPDYQMLHFHCDDKSCNCVIVRS